MLVTDWLRMWVARPPARGHEAKLQLRCCGVWHGGASSVFVCGGGEFHHTVVHT